MIPNGNWMNRFATMWRTPLCENMYVKNLQASLRLSGAYWRTFCTGPTDALCPTLESNKDWVIIQFAFDDLTWLDLCVSRHTKTRKFEVRLRWKFRAAVDRAEFDPRPWAGDVSERCSPATRSAACRWTTWWRPRGIPSGRVCRLGWRRVAWKLISPVSLGRWGAPLGTAQAALLVLPDRSRHRRFCQP